VRGSCALPQDSMSLLGHIFDLHARHGAIMALEAPVCKRAVIGMCGRLRHVAGNMVGQDDAQSRCEDFSTGAFFPKRCAWRHGLYAARRGCALACS
jgi:hypothetical protein